MKEWKYFLKSMRWYLKARSWRFGGGIWNKLAEKNRLRGDLSARDTYILLTRRWYANALRCYDKGIEYATIFRDLRKAK